MLLRGPWEAAPLVRVDWTPKSPSFPAHKHCQAALGPKEKLPRPRAAGHEPAPLCTQSKLMSKQRLKSRSKVLRPVCDSKLLALIHPWLSPLCGPRSQRLQMPLKGSRRGSWEVPGTWNMAITEPCHGRGIVAGEGWAASAGGCCGRDATTGTWPALVQPHRAQVLLAPTSHHPPHGALSQHPQPQIHPKPQQAAITHDTSPTCPMHHGRSNGAVLSQQMVRMRFFFSFICK